MWVMERNNIGVMNPILDDEYSWEEEAFAEDGRGGLVWPPRSYSCRFCKREFRSAQALGGHMNIHRRERAKLKQSLDSLSTTPPQNPNLSNFPNPSFSSSPSSSRVSLRTVCSNSDTKTTSCVSDDQVQMLLPIPDDHGAVETKSILGFRLDFRGFDDDEEVMNCKRRKTIVMPLIMGSIEEVDLELRLAT